MEVGNSATSTTPAEPLLRPPARPVRANRLAALLGRAAGRRGPSALVRETAALQLEERRADWAYSRPVVALDVAWNLAFAVAAAVVLAASARERPPTPVRVWIAGYGLQCLIHVALVWTEYRSRRRSLAGAGRGRHGAAVERAASDSDSNDSQADADEAWSGNQPSIAKRCETLNTMVSFLWWIVGFYWVVSGGEALLQNAPMLYWLTVVFLAFDVFFAIFCVALACVIGIALCCCLPCIIAILYAVAGQEGASDADISILPRYQYVESCNDEEKSASTGTMIPIMHSTETSSSERLLLHENAECCICLSSYEEGTELHALPCNHHFHSTCIIKWLRINATCPLCKYNILKGSEAV